jgi:hypothetical protein
LIALLLIPCEFQFMTSLDPKYVAADRPVNRRTSPKLREEKAPVPAVVQERLAALRTKHRFGAPLSEQIRLSQSSQGAKKFTPANIFVGVIFTVSTLIGLLAAIQKSALLAGGAGIVLAFGVGFWWHANRKTKTNSDSSLATTVLFDDASLAAFDQALESLDEEVDEDIYQQLLQLKRQIINMAMIATKLNIDEHCSMDDRHYLRESLRRYLPDSLQSYLRVPASMRSSQCITADHTASDLLKQQLALLQTELSKREAQLTKNAAEQLVRQQRFLEEKISAQ